MRVEGLQIEFPTLTENPFSTSPLETGQESLYVGRLDVRGRISKHINFRSNRRLLIVGEMGSGRTSLLRCSASEAPVYVHIDHISATKPAHSLLENLYSQLIDYNIPHSRAELAHKIVEASHAYTSKIPLIVIDMPTVETSVVTVALRDALPMLERLKAVVVVVVEPKQRSILPDSILQSFASIETLEPLTIDEVKVLIERRVSSATSRDFQLSTTDAEYIHSLSGGKPSEVIRFMRDSIDVSLHSDMYEQTIPRNSVSIDIEAEHYEPNIYEEPEDIPESQIQGEDDSGLDSEVIDASMPWQERDSVIENPSSKDAVTEIFGFDLDLEGLSDSKLEDEPIETFTYSATPENEEILIADSSPPPPPINAGTFHALLGRTRDYKKENDSQEDIMVKDEESSGAELWVSEDLITPDEIVLDFTKEDSAALIHDEIGLPQIDTEDLENIIEFDETDTEEITNIVTSNLASSYEERYLSPILQALQEILVNNKIPENQRGGQRKLAEALAGMRREKQGEKHDFPLNPVILSSLSHSESYVVSVAQERRFSPSDKEILGELEIKRPRLSQISNHLLKSGILNVRTVGRSRYFQLTQDARAQLTAWGLIGGVE
jgi:energy-coupling factor transporter ATP-binding protein EcfA2